MASKSKRPENATSERPMKRKFPVLAVIVHIFALAWLFSELG